MRYTLVVRQSAVVDAELVGKVNVVHLCLLDYLRGWFFCGGAERETWQGRKFVWLRYETAIEQLPLLFNPQARLASRKNQLSDLIQKLCHVGLVETHRKSRRLYFRLTDLGVQLTKRGKQPSPAAAKLSTVATSRHDKTVSPGHDETITSARDESTSANIDEPGIKESETKETPPLSPCEGEETGILAFWNSFPDLPKAITLTRSRTRKIGKRLADPWWRQYWRDGIKRLAASDFCKGGGPHDWRATFDWFLGGDSLTKILEGAYDNRPSKPKNQSPPRQAWQINEDLRRVRQQLKEHPRTYWPGNEQMPDQVQRDYDKLVERRKALEAEFNSVPHNGAATNGSQREKGEILQAMAFVKERGDTQEYGELRRELQSL